MYTDRQENTELLINLKSISYVCIVFLLFEILIGLIAVNFYYNNNNVSLMCGYTAILGAIIPLLYSLYKRELMYLFSCISILNLAPIWFLYLEAVLPGYNAYEYIEPEFKIYMFLWVAVFQICVNIFYYLLWKRFTSIAIKKFSFLNLIKISGGLYIKLTIFTFTFPLICFYLYYNSLDILWTALTAGRSGGGGSGLIMRKAVGDNSSFMVPLVWIWQLTPLLSCIAYIVSNRSKKLISFLSLTLGIIVIFVFFLGGSRSSMMFVAAPTLFYFFYYNKDKGAKFWFIAITIFFILIAIMELQVRFRGNLLSVLMNPAAAAKSKGYSSVTTFDVTESHRDNNTYLFCLILKAYPKKYGYEGFNDFFAIILNPIPRAIWANKPLMSGAKDISTQKNFILEGPLVMKTTSLTFSVVGNAYIAYGLLGIVVYSFLYSGLAILLDGLIYYINPKRPIYIGLLGLSIFIIFWGYRDLFALVSFMYPLVLFITLLKGFQKYQSL